MAPSAAEQKINKHWLLPLPAAPSPPCSSLSAGLSSFPSSPLPPLLWLFLPLSSSGISAPRAQGCAGHWAARISSLGELHPHQPRALLHWHRSPRNKSRFKCHQLRLSPSPLFPRQQSCPSLPFLSFPVTFPGNKLQGAIMPCAKENIKAGTISVEDVARRAATQKRAGKFIKLPVGWSTHLQCTRSPSELSEISLLFLLLFIFPSLQGTK